MFDHEKLDVYQLELSLITWITDLLEEIRDNKAPRIREAADQIDRSSLSCLLNTAEGNAKRQPALRTKYFDYARGSAVESAACLDALVAKRATSAKRVLEGKEMLLRIVRMLTGLCPIPLPGAVREESVSYTTYPDTE